MKLSCKIALKTVSILILLQFLFFGNTFSDDPPTFTYYPDTGNVETYYNSYSEILYTFEDDNYYDVDGGHGHGRLIRVDWQDGSGGYYAYDYYGDTLNVKNMSFKQDAEEKDRAFTDEPFYEIPCVDENATGRAVSTCVININCEHMSAYVVKYDDEGLKMWSKYFIENGDVRVTAVAMDAAGNVIAAGTNWDGSDGDIYVVKYAASDGTKLGEYTYDGGGDECVNDVAVDQNGDIILTGRSGQWPNSDILTVKLDAGLDSAPLPVLWDKLYDSGGSDMGFTLEIDPNNDILTRGTISPPGSDGGCYEVLNDTANGAIISEGYDDTERPFRGYWIGVTSSGRLYAEEGTYGEEYEFGLNIGFIEDTGRQVVTYMYLEGASETQGNALMFLYYDEEYNNTVASRIIFDSGLIAETIFGDSGVTYPQKVINPDGSTCWFLWDETYGGEEHRHIVILRTPLNEWLAFTFIPDLEHPENLMNPDNWTPIGPVADPGSLELPELGEWPQDGVTVEYPQGLPALYYESGRVMCRRNGESFEYYLDEDYYAEGSHEGRLLWLYRTSNGTRQVYHYFDSDTDRVEYWDFYGHGDFHGNDETGTGEFHYIFETYYNEKFYDEHPYRGEMNLDDGWGRFYQFRNENGIETFLGYYEGTDHCALARQDMYFGRTMRVVSSYKNYYSGEFTNKKIQFTLEAGSVGPDGDSIEGTVIDFSINQDNDWIWVVRKVAFNNGDTCWFIYDDTYQGVENVVLEKTNAGDWHAYTFDPNFQPEDLIGKNWTPLPEPAGGQTELVEAYWPAINPDTWPLEHLILEYPPLETEYTYEEYAPGQNRVVTRLDHNDYMDTRYEYTWDTLNGTVTELTYYVIDGPDTLAAKTRYNNGTDYDLENKPEWDAIGRVAYYESGNIRYFITDWGKKSVYMDENYYQTPTGQGRVMRYEEPDGRIREIEYYCDSSSRVKTLTAVGKETQKFYNEDYFDNTMFIRDSGGNIIRITKFVNEEYLNFDYYVIKTDSDGAKIWSKIYGGNAYWEVMAVTVDSENNVIVTGSNWEAWVTLKYTSDGILMAGFPVAYDSPYGEYGSPHCVATDSQGNIIIAGDIGATESSPRDFLTLKYDSNGNLLWDVTFDGGYDDSVWEVYIDEDDNISLIGGRIDPEGGPYINHYAINYDRDGNLIGEGQTDNRSYYANWEMGGIAGREYIVEDDDGGIDHRYAYYHYVNILGYTENVSPTLGNAMFFSFPMTSPEVTVYGGDIIRQNGMRLEFDSGLVAEIVYVDESVNDDMQLTKAIDPGGNTFWFLYGAHEIEGQSYDNVVIEHTAGGNWNAYYGFNPDTQNPENVMDRSGWTFIGTVDPRDLDLPELGNWEEHCARYNITPEYPPLRTDYIYDSGRVIERLDHNPYADTRYEYTWDTVNGKVTELVYHIKDATETLFSKTIYNNGADTDIANKSEWNMERQITYYESGNIRMYYDGYSIYTFENKDYYDYYILGEPGHEHGRGRLVKNEWEEGDGGIHSFNCEYYGDTLNLESITKPFSDSEGVVSGIEKGYTFYNEDFIRNSRSVVDSEGNRIVTTLVFNDDFMCKAYTVKYNSSGAVLWRQEFDTFTDAFNVICAVDESDNIYTAAAKYDGGSGSNDIVVYKYGPDGAFLDNCRHDLGGYDSVTDILVDSSGGIYVSGTTGDWPDQGIFIIKLNPDFTETWRDVHNSAYKDNGGYLSMDRLGNIELHGYSQDDPEYQYFKFNYTPEGVRAPINHDGLRPNIPNIYLGLWSTGRRYQYTSTQDSHTRLSKALGYELGTGIVILEEIEGEEYFPQDYGAMTSYIFIDPVTYKDIGVRGVFANGTEGEAVFGDDGEGFYITKISGYDDNAYWFLWDVEYDGAPNKYVVIEKTQAGVWTAYNFNSSAQSFEELMGGWTEIGPIANPENLDLPELGDWWKWVINEAIVPEFPSLSSGYIYDGLDRVIERLDHNPYTDTTYTYDWDHAVTGQVKEDMSYDYNDDGNVDLIATRVYDNGTDYDITNINTWQILSEDIKYYDSGVLKKYVTAHNPCDFNLNGRVELSDFSIVRSYRETAEGATLLRGDTNADGAVDSEDYDNFNGQFGKRILVRGVDTLLNDTNGNPLVQIFADGHREIYIYTDGPFTEDDLLASGILKEGDIVVDRTVPAAPEAEEPINDTEEQVNNAPAPAIPGDQEVISRLQTQESAAGARRNTRKFKFYNELKGKKTKYLDWLKG